MKTTTQPTTPYLLQTPDGKLHAAEWGWLAAPENRQNQAANTIHIPFVRFKCSAPATAGLHPPLVFLTGGPGIDTFQLMPRLWASLAYLQPYMDVIFMGQRGTTVGRPRLDMAQTEPLPLDEPLSFENEVAAVRERLRLTMDFWRGQGVDLAGYNVREMAADLNDLRQHLGYERLNLMGGSFGSHHAIAMMRDYGQHLERVILRKGEGPNHTVKLPGTIQQILVELNRRVQADERLAPAIPDLLALIERVLNRLDEKPLRLPLPRRRGQEIVVGKYDLQTEITARLGSTRFLQGLPALFYKFDQGDFSWLADKAAGTRRRQESNLMPLLVDYASGATEDRWAQIAREAEETLLADAINEAFYAVDDLLGPFDLGDEFRTNLASNIPTLMIVGSLDARTPVSNAKEMGKLLPNSHLLVVDGVTHDMGFGTPLPEAARQAELRFLTELSPPAELPDSVQSPFKFDALPA